MVCTRFTLIVSALALSHFVAAQDALRPIDNQRPLLVFAGPGMEASTATESANAIIEAWTNLPDELKPYSVLEIPLPTLSITDRHDRILSVLEDVAPAGIPVMIQISAGNPDYQHPYALVEQILDAFPDIVGVAVRGLEFNEYPQFTGGPDFAAPPGVRWLEAILRLTAQHEKRVLVALDGLHWPRLMANESTRPLYELIRKNAVHVLPVVEFDGAHVFAQIGSLLGLWLEGSAAHWGVGATSHWYKDAYFRGPLPSGSRSGEMPPLLYRAMILNGAMTGASIYTFSVPRDLWHAGGAAWEGAIYPCLTEIIEKGYIASRRAVKREVQAAYRMRPAADPAAFHLNLRDIDARFAEGLMLRGLFGLEDRAQLPELVPNRSRFFWLPILSPHAPTPARFRRIIHPAELASGAAWRNALASHYNTPDAGDAFIARIGRAVFVLHTQEQAYEQQRFHLDYLPTPVRDIVAHRVADHVVLTWPFREDDLSYTVWRRDARDMPFQVLARNVADRRYTDTAPPSDVAAYTVTAITSEREPFSGTVNFGDYLVFSQVESRMEEEVILYEGRDSGMSWVIATPPDNRPSRSPAWRNLESLPDSQRDIAIEIADRIDTWRAAVAAENLDGLTGIYSQAYSDPQGWGSEYVRRAYQWFFERHEECHMVAHVDRWEFAQDRDADRVSVYMHARVRGVARSDSTGRIADIPIEFPRTADSMLWVSFVKEQNHWRITSTNPALPNFRDLLHNATGPYENLHPGPDIYRGPRMP